MVTLVFMRIEDIMTKISRLLVLGSNMKNTNSEVKFMKEMQMIVVVNKWLHSSSNFYLTNLDF